MVVPPVVGLEGTRRHIFETLARSSQGCLGCRQARPTYAAQVAKQCVARRLAGLPANDHRHVRLSLHKRDPKPSVVA
jgi:hypothetical protein